MANLVLLYQYCYQSVVIGILKKFYIFQPFWVFISFGQNLDLLCFSCFWICMTLNYTKFKNLFYILCLLEGIEFTNRQTWAGKYRGSYFTQRTQKHGWRRVLFFFYTTCKQKRYINLRFKATCISVTCIITMIEWVSWKRWIFESHNFGKWKNYLLEHSSPLLQPSLS